MITMSFNRLNAADKLIYFEAATNSVLQNLLQEELKYVEEQILTLDKRSEETESDFMRRFNDLKTNRKLLLDFIEINQTAIEDIQNLRK